MPAPEVWGPPIWTLFHCFAARIKEDHYTSVIPSLFNQIVKICSLLPCPECSEHATLFLSKVNIKDMPTKQHFINLLYNFHNSVNRRKRKNLFDYEKLPNYEKIDLAIVIKNFITVYNTKGNMKLLNESFRRTLILKGFHKWLQENHKFF
jgi:hypothetical protein